MTPKHKVVPHEKWFEARKAFLAKEKKFTKLRDDLSRQRRGLPWEKVEKAYLFDGPDGKETLGDLFGKRSQLLVYHFMFGPDDKEGCKHCSFWADTFDGTDVHLNHRDISFVVISRAPFKKIKAFRKRMGWSFKWVSSSPSDFNYDFQVSFTQEQIKSGGVVYNYEKAKINESERQGVSVFVKDGGAVYHTYSTYARGIDIVNGAYNFIDFTPRGRDEGNAPQSWVRHHDRYED